MIGAKLELPTKSQIIEQMVAMGADPAEAEQAADVVIGKVGRVNQLMLTVEGVYDPMLRALMADSLDMPLDERPAFLLNNIHNLISDVVAAGVSAPHVLMLSTYILEAVRILEGERLASAYPDRLSGEPGEEVFALTKPPKGESRFLRAIKAADESEAMARLNQMLSGS